MIWGITLNNGECFNLAGLANRGQILRISHISLCPETIGKSTIYVSYDNNRLVLASLNSER